jgi:hypothetical protein
MRKRFTLLLAGLTLSPVMAEAAGCRLDQATFRPKLAQEDLSQQFVSEFQLLLSGFRCGGKHVQGQAF